MTPIKVQLDHVTYNAATRAFEARAILHDHGNRYTYACAIDAPITMEFDDAAGRMSRQAFRLHRVAGHMRKMRRTMRVPPLLASAIQAYDTAA